MAFCALRLCLLLGYCVVLSSPSSPLVWFPTREGLASHMRQLEEIWRHTGPKSTGDSQGRQIVIAPTDSDFYKDVPAVLYCDLFKFPPRVTCESQSNRSSLMASASSPCTLAGRAFAPWYGWPAELPSVQVQVPQIDWKRTTCLGGFIWDSLKHGGKSDARMPWSFQPKYKDLLRTLKQSSGALPATNDFVVAHWRRGNQLTNRCLGLNGEDSSVNCKTPAELIAEITRLQLLHWPGQEHRIVYVATNEESAEHTRALAQAGYKIFSDLLVPATNARNQAQASQSQVVLTSLDRFALELVLLCDAKVLLQWGNSTSHHLVEGCRGGDVDKTTIVNGAVRHLSTSPSPAQPKRPPQKPKHQHKKGTAAP